MRDRSIKFKSCPKFATSAASRAQTDTVPIASLQVDGKPRQSAITQLYVPSWNRRAFVLCLALFAAIAPISASVVSANVQMPAGPVTDSALGEPTESQLLQLLAEAEGKVEPSSAQMLRLLTQLAEYYVKNQRWNEAVPIWQKIVRLQENGFGKQSLEVATSLLELARTYGQLGRFKDAIEQASHSLRVHEESLPSNDARIATVLDSLSFYYHETGQFAVALELGARSLEIRKTALTTDDPGLGQSFNNYAQVLGKVGRFAEALKMHESGLEIRERALGPQHPDVAQSLNNLAIFHHDQGRYLVALPMYERSLAIWEAAYGGADHPNIAFSVNNQAGLHLDMGNYSKAVQMFDRSLAIRQRLFGPEHPATARAMSNLAEAYFWLGRVTEALRLNGQALEIRQRLLGPEHPDIAENLQSQASWSAAAGMAGDPEVVAWLNSALAMREKLFGKNHPFVGQTLNALGVLHRHRGEFHAASKYLERSLSVLEGTLPDGHPYIGQVSQNLSAVRMLLDDPEGALPLLLRAERIAAVSSSPEVLLRAQNGLRRLHAQAQQHDLAIFWGKRSVNTIQELRAGLTAMDRSLQQSFLSDKRFVYTGLADLLIEVGRLAEAQQVLAMLKEEELHDFLRRDSTDDPRSARAAYVGPVERSADARWRDLSRQLSGLGRERRELQIQARLGLSDTQKARLKEIEDTLRDASLRYDSFIAGLTEEFVQAGAPRLKEIGERQLDNLATLQATLREIGGDTVLLHYVVTDRRVAIIVTTPDVQVAREGLVTAAELNRRVQALRTALHERGDVLPHAQALYQWLIAPVAADLHQVGARKLALSLDGTLRYVPFAVLHDGRAYLVERYPLSMYSEAARGSLRRTPSAKWDMTGLGLTRAVPGFTALPAVKAELEGLRGRIMSGEVYLDEQFTAQRLTESLVKSASVLHIASHFAFRPGTEADSFLVLGDGSRMTLQEMRARRLHFGALELLTLSACDTAMGGGRNENGAEVEGFGALAQRQGAQAVLATLWPVADRSTGRFMLEMYSRRQSRGGLSKTQALRQAQLAFLRGSMRDARKADAQLAHPFYWAPYVLMGNWL